MNKSERSKLLLWKIPVSDFVFFVLNDHLYLLLCFRISLIYHFSTHFQWCFFWKRLYPRTYRSNSRRENDCIPLESTRIPRLLLYGLTLLRATANFQVNTQMGCKKVTEEMGEEENPNGFLTVELLRHRVKRLKKRENAPVARCDIIVSVVSSLSLCLKTTWWRCAS